MSRAPGKERREPLLRLRAFRGLWIANALTDLAFQVMVFAASVVMIEVLHADAFTAGMVQPLSNLGPLLLGLFAGVWVDNLGSFRMLRLTSWLRLLCFVVLPASWLAGWLSAWQVLLVVAVLSGVDILYTAAHFSVLPGIVGRSRLGEANSSLHAADQAIVLVGPGLAGQLVKGIGAPLAPLVSVLAQIGSLFALRSLPMDSPRAGGRKVGLRTAVGESIRFVMGNTILRTVTFAAALNNLAAGFYVSVEALFVLRTLDLEPVVFGWVTSIGGIGGIVGALLAPRLARRFGALRTIFVGAVTMPLAFALLPLAQWLPLPAVVVAADFVLFSVAIMLFGVNSASVAARVTPTSLLARVSSVRRTLTQGVLVLGGAAGAVLAQALGITVPLWVAAVIATAQIPVLLAGGIPRVADVEDVSEDAAP